LADWDYIRRQGLCSACGHEFVDNESVFSMLRLEAEELQRGDLCSKCFDSRDQASDLVWWRTCHLDSRSGLKLDIEAILALFQKLEEVASATAGDLRFLLALLLVRHRRLRLIGVRMRGQREFLQLRKVRTKDLFEAEVRELEPERREKLTRALAELMDPTQEGGLADLLVEPAEDS
jgi:hypothetical protein